MFTLLTMLALGQLDDSTQVRVPHSADMRVRRAGGRSSSQPPATFSLASQAVCTCAAAGDKGEALTMTRGSAATCAKQGAATTGINNGDLVSCTNNQPRVELGGYLRESASSNFTLDSENINGASWSLDGSPVRTANSTTAPDGNLTADTLDDQSGAAFAGIFNASAAVAGTYSCSLYAKGGTSTTPLFQLGDVGGTGLLQQVTPTLSTTTWSRFCLTITTGGATTGVRQFIYPATPAAATGAIFLWGMQCEAGPICTSYMGPTVAAAVNRSADSALTGTMLTAVGTSFSMAATATFQVNGATASTLVQFGTVAPALALIGNASDTSATLTVNATTTTPAVSAMGTTAQRASLFDNAGTRGAFWQGGAVAAPAASMVGTTTAVTIGALNARTGAVCIDNDPTRCR